MKNGTLTLRGGGRVYRYVLAVVGTWHFADDHRASEIPIGLLKHHLDALRRAEPVAIGRARLVAWQAGDGNLLTCVVEAPSEVEVLHWHHAQGLRCGVIRAADGSV